MPPPTPELGIGIVARVLIVEDEPTDRMILGIIVVRTGHEVIFASDGAQAAKIYMRGGIDVVITDLYMPPHNDGLELIEMLGALFPDTPVIAVSGQGPDLLCEAKRMGAVVALSKPIDPHELVKALVQAAPDSLVRPLMSPITSEGQ